MAKTRFKKSVVEAPQGFEGDLTGNVTGDVTGNWTVPVASVAATGTDQASAADLAVGFSAVTAADGTKGVKLPAAAAGLRCEVKNVAAAVLKIYPNTSDAINALNANASLDIAASTSCILVAADDTTWYSIPLLPS